MYRWTLSVREREREVKVERERESIANDPGPWPNGLGTERIV